jgi:FkbM family methyltransferase
MAGFSYKEAQIAELVSEFTDPKVREALELSALPEILRGTDYFIDVGANVGQYTFHAARHLRHARILAIEANPYLIPALTKTVDGLRALNGQDNQYEIKAAAVSDLPGTLDFYVSRFPTLSSVFPHQAAETVKVPTVPLDEFYLPSLRTVIKMDIEGAEYRAVRSASRFLASQETSFFIELHGWGDRAIGKYPIHLCWLFFRNGYAVRRIGTHYLFYRAGGLRRAAWFLRQCPYLGLKYLLFRYGRRFRPALVRLRNRLKSSSGQASLQSK